MANSERKRKRALKEGRGVYHTSNDGLLCLGVDETEKEFFGGLN